ncbi:MAG: phage minor capsid protein [bacterium]|nr:phage minor capsid protein [bacterium]
MATRPEDLVRLSEAEAKRLTQLYMEAELEILRQVDRAMGRGNDLRYLRGMLDNVQAILEDLIDGNRQWCEQAIPRVYVAGAEFADGLSGKASAGFGAIHQQAVKVLADNAFDRLDNVRQVIGRRVEDVYRQYALEATRQSIIGYKSWQQVSREFRDNLRAEGITGFRDAAGREWNMKTYADMVARTTTMEAHLTGTANRLLEHGHDLVRISQHAGACEKCRPWEGRILSLTGKTPGYPTLETARDAGLFHPRCRHAYGLYLDLDTEIEQLEQELGEDQAGKASQEVLRTKVEPLNVDHIDTRAGPIWLDPAPPAHHKSQALVGEALARAEQHASFEGVRILNIPRIDRRNPGVNAFVLPDEKANSIYLLASNVKRFAQMEAASIEFVHRTLGLQRSADATRRATDVVEYTKRVLLHELGHIVHKRVGQDILRTIDLSFKDYTLEIIKVGVAYGGPPDWVDVRRLAECIAEDFRLLVDPNSVYPHAHTAEYDLLYPVEAHARRQMLKVAMKW